MCNGTCSYKLEAMTRMSCAVADLCSHSDRADNMQLIHIACIRGTSHLRAYVVHHHQPA
jgi:hypothetical protein